MLSCTHNLTCWACFWLDYTFLRHICHSWIWIPGTTSTSGARHGHIRQLFKWISTNQRLLAHLGRITPSLQLHCGASKYAIYNGPLVCHQNVVDLILFLQDIIYIGQILKLRAHSFYFYLPKSVRLWKGLNLHICMATLYLFHLILATQKQPSSSVCIDYKIALTTSKFFFQGLLLQANNFCFLSFLLFCLLPTCQGQSVGGLFGILTTQPTCVNFWGS